MANSKMNEQIIKSIYKKDGGLDLECVFNAIYNFNRLRIIDKKQALTPLLIGWSGSGKTTKIEKFADDNRLKVVKVLLQNMLPEEFSGIPYVNEANEITKYTIPDWYKDIECADCNSGWNGSLLFLDELDKAPKEMYSSILTLLASREIRDKKLPDNCFVVAAMQPMPQDVWFSDETYKALMNRVIFMYNETNFDFFKIAYGLSDKEINDLNSLVKDSQDLDYYDFNDDFRSQRVLDYFIGLYLYNKEGIFNSVEAESDYLRNINKIINSALNARLSISNL